MNKIKSIVFVGTRQIGVNCLTHLIETIKESDTKIVGVLTTSKDPQWWSQECDPDVWQVAEAHGIPLIKEDDLLNLEYDLLFCAIYLKIFPQYVLDRAACYNINLHPGPVPNYRGCWGYQHAIINNEKEYGPSLHFMDKNIDAGDLIEVSKFPILPNDTSKSVYLKTLEAGFELFKKWLPNILNKQLISIGQNEYAEKNRIEKNCYAMNSLQKYFGEPIRSLTIQQKQLLIRALDFPPLFAPPEWLWD